MAPRGKCDDKNPGEPHRGCLLPASNTESGSTGAPRRQPAREHVQLCQTAETLPCQLQARLRDWLPRQAMQGCSVTGSTEPRGDGSHGWRVALDGDSLLRKDRQESRGDPPPSGVHGAPPGVEEVTEILGMRMKGRARGAGIRVGACYRQPDQEQLCFPRHVSVSAAPLPVWQPAAGSGHVSWMHPAAVTATAFYHRHFSMTTTRASQCCLLVWSGGGLWHGVWNSCAAGLDSLLERNGWVQERLSKLVSMETQTVLHGSSSWLSAPSLQRGALCR